MRVRRIVVSIDNGNDTTSANIVTVWERLDDDSWRAFLDIGTPARPAETQ